MVKNFLRVIWTSSEVHPTPIQWVSGVKRPGREADHPSPASAEVKKMWICTFTPPYAFMAYLTEHAFYTVDEFYKTTSQ
jgi:hypothetical protein